MSRSWMWWYRLIISAFWGYRPENQKFKTSLRTKRICAQPGLHETLTRNKKAKQKVARERQKTVNKMVSKTVWVRKGLAEVKWSRKHEYGTLYEEAERRSGKNRLQGGRKALVRRLCWACSNSFWDLCILQGPSPLHSTLSQFMLN